MAVRRRGTRRRSRMRRRRGRAGVRPLKIGYRM